MSSRNTAILLVIALTALGLSLQAWYWTQLPDRVATHFGINGNPNDWMSKTNATILLCSLQVGLPSIFLFIGWTLTKLPTSVINIPNREYWLQPERRLNSISRVTTMLAWVAVLIAMEIIAMVHLTFLANRSGASLDTNLFWIILGTFLLSVAGVVGRGMWYFRLPKSTGVDGY